MSNERTKLRKLADSLRQKLTEARDKGPNGPNVTLTAEEAIIAWRAIFGDLSNGHK